MEARFSGRDLGELENVLRLIADRVSAIVERLQQQEREALLAEQMVAFGQLAIGMAHELRNPLTSMKILVQGAMAAEGKVAALVGGTHQNEILLWDVTTGREFFDREGHRVGDKSVAPGR